MSEDGAPKGAKYTNDARERAILGRVLNQFKEVADSETYNAIKDYTIYKLGKASVETATNDVRLVTQMLVEMSMGQSQKKLKITDPDDGRRSIWNPELKVTAKSLSDLEKKDIRGYFADLPRYGKSGGRTNGKHYKAPLKAFLQWVVHEAEDDDDREEAKRWSVLVNAVPEWDDNQEADKTVKAIETAEIEKGLKAIDSGAYRGSSVKWKALVAQHWEGGLRPAELRGIRIRHVKSSPRNPNNALTVWISAELIKNPKKKHPRYIDIIEYAPVIERWLKEHPQKDNPDAFLFPSESNANYNGLMSRTTLNDFYNRVWEKVGLDKPRNPYHIRHSRITHVLRERMMPIEDAADYFGTSVSMILKHYRHVTPDDVNQGYLSNFEGGLVTQEPRGPKPVPKKPCPSCGTDLPVEARSCPHCDTLLIHAIKDRQTVKQQKLDSLTEAIANTDNAGTRKVLLKMYQDTQAMPIEEFQTDGEFLAECDALTETLKAASSHRRSSCLSSIVAERQIIRSPMRLASVSNFSTV